MPKHCSGIGINLFVQSKERNLFINVYFGAGSSLGCYKICIDRSFACIHFLWGHTQLDLQNGLRFIIEDCMPISVRRIILFVVVWCLVIIYSKSHHFITPPPLTQQLLHQYIVPPLLFQMFLGHKF